MAEPTAEVETTQAELARVTSVSGEQIDGLAKELDNERVKSELAKLRALEELRQEHQSALEREREYGNEERKRMEAWVHVGDLKESFKTERHHLLARITELEKEKQRWSQHEGELSGQITPLPRHTYMEVSGIGAGISEHEPPRTEMVPGAGVVGALGLGEIVAEPLATVSSSLSSPTTSGDEHPLAGTAMLTTEADEHSTTGSPLPNTSVAEVATSVELPSTTSGVLRPSVGGEAVTSTFSLPKSTRVSVVTEMDAPSVVSSHSTPVLATTGSTALTASSVGGGISLTTSTIYADNRG